MATETTQRDMMLVYDGDCPMCISTVGMLKRSGLVTPEQTVSSHDLSADEFSTAHAAGLRNQLVVLEPRTQETRSGTDGLLWIIGRNRGNPLWVRALSLPGVRHLVGMGYETISYNRRIVSPPRHAVRCDCEPEVTLGRRLMLVVPLLVATIALTAMFGATLFARLNLGDAATGAVWMIAGAGVGWVVMGCFASAALRSEQRIDYLAHLVVTAFMGVLVLLPAAVVSWWLPPWGVAALAIVSVLVSFTIMFRMQVRRIPAVGLSTRWLWAWSGVLVIALLGTTLFYFAERSIP